MFFRSNLIIDHLLAVDLYHSDQKMLNLYLILLQRLRIRV